MPHISKKKQFTRKLKQRLSLKNQWIKLKWFLSKQRPSVPELLLRRQLMTEIEDVEGRRYLQRRNYRSRRERAISEFEEDLKEHDGCWLTDEEFKTKYGVRRDSFWSIHEAIKDHPVFSRTNRDRRGRKQLKSQHQLLVLLAFLRTEGDGMSNQHGRTNFYVAYGTVDNFKDRVVTAILDVLYKDNYYWPDEAERRQIAGRFQLKHGIPNCVGVADGTMFPLAFKPQRSDYQDFHGRKHLYSLTTLIVNDDMKRVRYYLAGWAGSAHDERVFDNSRLCTESCMHFRHNEFILGDSAYSPRSIMIPAFKKPNGCTMPRELEVFNTHLSRARVTSEHTIGMLKSRFPFLRSIRMRLGEEADDMKKILKYVAVCITLHNILIGYGDEVDPFEEALSEIDADNELNRPVPSEHSSGSRRTQLLNYLLEKFH